MSHQDPSDPSRVVDARPGASDDEADEDQPPTETPEGADDEESLEELEDDLEAAAEVVEDDLASLATERDDYLDQLRRLQADFENYRKRVMKQNDEIVERASEGLVGELLPVLDACDAALQHGDAGVEPILKALADVLEKQGLEKVAPEGEAFDPNRHDAVAHEPGDGDPVVVEVLRPGYVWKGRVLRPAMVRVRG
jgi:molecular chaperone GrpE